MNWRCGDGCEIPRRRRVVDEIDVDTYVSGDFMVEIVGMLRFRYYVERASG